MWTNGSTRRFVHATSASLDTSALTITLFQTDMFNDYMRGCGLKACVVSVSGGVDSAVTYALCHRAMSKEGSPIKRVIGIAQPICSTASVWQRALELKDAFNGEIITIDQTEIHKQLYDIVEKAVS